MGKTYKDSVKKISGANKNPETQKQKQKLLYDLRNLDLEDDDEGDRHNEVPHNSN